MRPKRRKPGRSVKDTVRVIIHALILALLVRIFLFQPFNIPSGSMIPTLLIGDYLFVSKYSYGYSRYSFPFGLNLFSGRVWAKEPDRGDVVVFKLPRDNETDYIKRVIGLPGDEIQMIHGVLNINGKPVPKVKIDDFVTTDASGRERHMARYKETLAERRELSRARSRRGRLRRQHRGLQGAGRALLHDGRQSRQLDRQPLPVRGRLRAVRESGRQGADHLLLDQRREASFWQVWDWPKSVRWSRIFHVVH